MGLQGIAATELASCPEHVVQELPEIWTELNKKQPGLLHIQDLQLYGSKRRYKDVSA